MICRERRNKSLDLDVFKPETYSSDNGNSSYCIQRGFIDANRTSSDNLDTLDGR